MENNKKQQPEGTAENEKANYTSLPSDGPVSSSRSKGKSDLQDADSDEQTDDISGDLSGNASGNSDAADE